MGSPTFQDMYRVNYEPHTRDTGYGLQIVAPDTPYVAAAGQNKLYFIDTGFDVETAKHVKEQIEWAMVPRPGEYIYIDEVSATAQVKDLITNQTKFVFDPPYARVLFASGLNRHNPELNLPEHEPAGDCEVTYDLGASLTKRQRSCSDIGCYSHGECIEESNGNCRVCHRYRIDNECDYGMTYAIGICHKICSKAVDTPKKDGESDTSYYRRVDRLHWA